MDSLKLMNDFVSHHQCLLSVVACVVLTIMYVASLYIWGSSLPRDHPSVIKKRFFSVSCMMFIAPFFTMFFLSQENLDKASLLEQMGLRGPGLLQAYCIPLFLTVILFLGPLMMQFFSGIWKLYMEPVYWISSMSDLMWVRRQIMAPLTEEWVFRACMVPLLTQCLEPLTTVFVAPLLFGIAHFHHMYEEIKRGQEILTAFYISMFQFSYTSLFGAYSAFLFLRTGHFVAPLVAHMFCNHMGFPNFGEIFQHKPWHQAVIIFSFFLGLALWYVLLMPLTDPSIYSNKLHLNT